MAQTGGGHCAANQVLYNLGERGIEWDLLEACAGAKVAVMAYTPLGRGSIANNEAVMEVARRHGVPAATVVLAWTMRDPNVISIPKAGTIEHVEANRRAADLVLSAEDNALLDKAFPPPKKAAPLAVI
jgi:diketogulonate reductase-like aldo/keto reductase